MKSDSAANAACCSGDRLLQPLPGYSALFDENLDASNAVLRSIECSKLRLSLLAWLNKFLHKA